MTHHLTDASKQTKPLVSRWHTVLIAAFLGITVGGCITVGNELVCISGDCKNGHGTLQQPDGKYVRISEGTFKDGKLWEGKVSLALKNMDTIPFQEVSAGKIVWERPHGR
jgi:hypothetical protein